MTEYSCKPAPAAGPHAYCITIDFDGFRWIQRAPGEKVLPVRGIRGLYRPRTLGIPAGSQDRIDFAAGKVIEDADHLLRAIADLESNALPTAEARARMWI